MSNAKHTAGPWTWDGITSIGSGLGFYDITQEVSGKVIAKLQEQPAANARLIATAPELLDALERLSAQCTRLRLPDQPETDAEKTARAVIAKATGGAA